MYAPIALSKMERNGHKYGCGKNDEGNTVRTSGYGGRGVAALCYKS